MIQFTGYKEHAEAEKYGSYEYSISCPICNTPMNTSSENIHCPNRCNEREVNKC